MLMDNICTIFCVWALHASLTNCTRTYINGNFFIPGPNFLDYDRALFLKQECLRCLVACVRPCCIQAGCITSEEKCSLVDVLGSIAFWGEKILGQKQKKNIKNCQKSKCQQICLNLHKLPRNHNL